MEGRQSRTRRRGGGRRGGRPTYTRRGSPMPGGAEGRGVKRSEPKPCGRARSASQEAPESAGPKDPKATAPEAGFSRCRRRVGTRRAPGSQPPDQKGRDGSGPRRRQPTSSGPGAGPEKRGGSRREQRTQERSRKARCGSEPEPARRSRPGEPSGAEKWGKSN